MALQQKSQSGQFQWSTQRDRKAEEEVHAETKPWKVNKGHDAKDTSE